MSLYQDQETRLHNCPVPIIGLTGGIGTGKSTVSKILKEKGFFIIDADELVHEIYDEQETLDFVKTIAPEVVQNNMLNFMILRKVAFEKKDLLKQLEDYLYQRMPSAFIEKVNQSKVDLVIYDVPLLFEKGLHEKVDKSVVVYASKEQQLQRASSRDQCSTDVISQVIAKQMDIEEKKSKADIVIDNTKDLEHLKIQVEKFIELF